MRTCFVSTWFCFSWCVLFILVIHTHTHTHTSHFTCADLRDENQFAVLSDMSDAFQTTQIFSRRGRRSKLDRYDTEFPPLPSLSQGSTRLAMCWSGFVLVLVCFFFVIVWSLVLLYVVYFLLSRGLFLRSWFWSGLLLLICRYVALFLCWWVGLLLLLCWYFLFVNYWCLCYCVA